MPNWKITSDPPTTPDLIEADGFEILSNYIFWNSGEDEPVAAFVLPPGASVVRVDDDVTSSKGTTAKKDKGTKKDKGLKRAKRSKGKKK